MKATIADVKVTKREVDIPEKCPNPECGADLTAPCAITGWEFQDQQRPCSFDGECVTDDTDAASESPEGGETFISWIALHCASCSFELESGDREEVDAAAKVPTSAGTPEIHVHGVLMSYAAAANVAETGADVRGDVEALRTGTHTRASLLAHCLDGADSDRVQGWHDYVEAVGAAAAKP